MQTGDRGQINIENEWHDALVLHQFEILDMIIPDWYVVAVEAYGEMMINPVEFPDKWRHQ